MNLETFITIIELAGTIAFAISGAMIGVKRNMDIFGICVLGVTTAVGGGIIRDVVLGNVPSSLITPTYVVVAVITSVIVFFLAYINTSKINSNKLYDNIMMAMDSFGLGIFTVMGIKTGIDNGYLNNMFLLVFLGTITGVGGGLLRDIMAGTPPYILTKDIYACASIIGAIICVWVYRIMGQIPALIIPIMIIVLIRFLARHYNWNLPNIKQKII